MHVSLFVSLSLSLSLSSLSLCLRVCVHAYVCLCINVFINLCVYVLAMAFISVNRLKVFLHSSVCNRDVVVWMSTASSHPPPFSPSLVMRCETINGDNMYQSVRFVFVSCVPDLLMFIFWSNDV